LNQQFETLALHVRVEVGRFSTLAAHIVKEKINSIEHEAKFLLAKTRLIGPHASRWSEAALKEHGIQGMQIVQGLLSLTRSCECSAIEEACEIAGRSSSLRIRSLARLLRIRQASLQTTGFTDKHPLIRPIREVRLKEQRIARPAETSEAAQSPKTAITSTGLVERSRFNQ
jgi:hypothetical protein